jgi:hypothetical protein
MHQISELSKQLNDHFNWNKAKMDCFVGMLIGLLKTRNINLTEIAIGFASDIQPGSRYRRVQRFIHGHRINFDSVAWFVMALFGFIDSPYYLAMDRTNWKWGKKDINILVLAVVYKGVAIPVYWLLLKSQGNSSTRERIALMNRFTEQFGKGRLQGLLADREFIGEAWLAWLKSEQIDFHIRIKKDAKVPNSRGEPVQAKQLFLWRMVSC